MQLPCDTPSRALNAMLSPDCPRERVWFADMDHCSTYLVSSPVSFPGIAQRLNSCWLVRKGP